MAPVEIKYTKLFINNEWVDAVSKKTFPTINPVDETVIATVSEGDKADVDLAVAAAKKAFYRYSEWRLLDASQRGKLLIKLADLIERDIDYITQLETIDGGKTISSSKLDIQLAASTIRYYAGKADKITGNTIPADGEVMSITLKEPVGVCAQILPWNVPFLMFAFKAGVALAAGCTTVVKPAEQTPLTALVFASLVKEAGFPPGVLNVITGYGHTAGHSLTHHPDVNKVAFTGSTEVGRLILKAAGEVNLKRVSLELGGKGPLVIFDDYDVEQAAFIAYQAIFSHSGQICVAGSRTFVQAGIYDKFIQRAAELAQNRKIGDPNDDTIEQGPQIDKEMFEKVLNYIKIGDNSGARCVAGGKRVGEKGYFIEPTVFADVKDDMTIAREEIFGPVQSILKFDSLEEVIDRCNDTSYGLSAAVLTNDLSTALTFSKHVQAGTVWVNTYFHIVPQAPFGGFKNSGLGRELGAEGIEGYLETKTITINLPKQV